MISIQHTPDGDPCGKCGQAAIKHKVSHAFAVQENSALCGTCGLRKFQHIVRRTAPRKRIDTRVRPAKKEHPFAGPGTLCETCGEPKEQHRAVRKGRDRKGEPTTYIGIDGEGQGRKNHRYILLAASTEDGADEWVVQVPEREERGLSTVECLDMILSIGGTRTNRKIFSFAFNYDLTKMLTDVPTETIWALFRPEERKGKFGPRPVEYCPVCSPTQDSKPCNIDSHTDTYQLNLQGTKFTVKRGKTRVVIWDLFKFFQGKFVTAIKDWKVGDQALWDRISLMKDKRNEFDKEGRLAILRYCLEETRCIAQLAHKLVDAHEGAGLELKSFYGAGSSGAAMLTAMGIKEKIVKPLPEMERAIAQAFFGGRFENSVTGPIRDPLVNWDISSAYVYQLAFLPCLEHGSWAHSTKRESLEKAQAQNGALVRYSLRPDASVRNWGPFPFRDSDGSISFPCESGGGWIWLDEYLQGEKLFPNVVFHEAWVYSCNCACKPFAQIPEYYNLRQKLGKEGAGLVIKLGMNSCYGKLAQSIGNAIFNSWIWAGMITSGTRAQLLELMGLHKDRSDVLMMATDGLLTRDRSIVPPTPMFTGTGATGKALGGWERKEAPKGMFIARPGIYFPIEPTQEEIASVRARGVGRSVVLEYWRLIVAEWAKDGIHAVAKVANVSRFCGAKTCTSVRKDLSEPSDPKLAYKRADGTYAGIEIPNSPSYGQWVSREVSMTFDPLPKRAGLEKDGVSLTLRKFPQSLTSVPYARSVMMMSEEAKKMVAAYNETMEQPDCDLVDYEDAQDG